jgi:RNA polymerase sigma-70 factor (ECF subfamily)
MEPSDAALLSQAREGSAEAIDRLLARHERRIYRFGLRMCGDEEAAREVLQETLLAAFRGVRDFRQDAALSTWLFQIARSFCVKERRLRSEEPRTLAPLEAPEAQAVRALGPSQDVQTHARELGAAIQAALLALPEDLREAVVLRDVEGLSAEEAAGVLEVEVGALKSRLHRGRMALRGHLADLLEVPTREGPPACEALAGELAAYASADIDQAACVRIERHLRSCPRCAAACESLKSNVRLCQRIPGDGVPVPVQRAVRAALLAAVG